MRKFALLLLAYAITLFGLRLIAGDVDFMPYVLRDGLLLALAGVILFAVNAAPLYRPLVAADVRSGWKRTGRLLWITGLIGALVGGSLMLIDLSNPTLEALRVTLWLLGLLLMLVGAAWRGQESKRYSPPTHVWSKDEQGEFRRTPVDGVEVDETAERLTSQVDAPGRRVKWIFLLIIVLIGAVLRLWKLSQLPGGCVDAECALGLQLMQGDWPLIEAGLFSPYGWLAQMIFTVTEQGLLSLRMAGALFGIATLPAFFLAARRMSGVTGALTATALLALSPWHIIASRGADGWIVLPLLLSLGLWALMRGLSALEYGGSGRGDWALAGVSLGVMALIAPELLYALWLWIGLTIALILLVRRASWAEALPSMIVFMAGALLTSLPVMAGAGGTVDIAASAGLLPGLITGLLNENGWRLGLPLLATATAALSVSGVGVLVRWIRRLPAAVLLLGAMILAGRLALISAGSSTGASTASVATLLLAALPMLFLFAAVALDQLLGRFARIWQRVISPAVVLGVALGLVMLLVGRDAFKLMRDLERLTTADDPAITAMATYLVDTFDSDAEQPVPEQTLLFAPPALFDTPSARLVAGPLLESTRIQPLRDVNDLITATASGSDITVLASPADQSLLTLLEQFYPNSEIRTGYDDEGRSLFTRFAVNADDASFQPGLAGVYYGDGDFATVTGDQRDGALTFDWSAGDDLASPFSVSWSGSLLVPGSGRYHFSVDGADAPGTLFSLQLDDQIVLDSSLGLFEKPEILADGYAGLTMRYRTTAADSPPLVVNWTRPDGVMEPIPATALVSPGLPNLGLLATYYAGDGFAGAALDLRKELLIGGPINVPDATSVVWRGKLAAPRAGEYMLGVVADGRYELMIDGKTLVNSAVVDNAEGVLEKYGEARAYLDRGWHEIDLRFLPATDDSQLRLIWQPPGESAAPLPGAYLAPIRVEITELDYPLPPSPPLSNEQLGDDRFALTRVDGSGQDRPIAPPDGLPPLPVSLMWQTNAGCGDGPAQLARPHGVALDTEAGRIYVADTANRRIAVYTLDGETLTVINDDRFLELADVALAPGGELLVLDAETGQIFRVNPTDATVTHMPVDASFYHPRGLGVDKLGMMAVADTGGARVMVIEPQGNVVAEFGGQGTPFGRSQPVDALLSNALWSITAEDGRLWNLYADAGFTAISKAVSMDGPHLAGLEGGPFFLTDPSRRTLFYHHRSGRPLAQFAYPDFFELPTGIAAAMVDDMTQLVVVDTARCSLSLWRIPVGALDE